jgi:hypothetical protein
MNKIEELESLLKDQYWRLNHLYRIRDAAGESIQFKMNVSQQYLYDNMHYFNVILKARQLGFSTFIMIYLLDSCLFNSNQACGVIAHTRNDAEELFRNKIRFAYDNLPDWVRENIGAKSETSKKLEFTNGSSIVVGTSLRGGTFQKLHVSEYGKIAARYPEKAREIKTGALNTVHAGQQIFIESTAEGRQGEFFDICELARKLKDSDKELTSLDPKFHFFSWFMNPEYIMSDEDSANTSITNEVAEYFKTLPVELTPNQKAWYVKKEAIQGDMMKREYPSTPKEAFEQSMEGAYYTKQMEIVRKNKQITHVPHETSKPVHTFWDIGQGADEMAIWFFQHIGNQYRFIRYHESSNEGWEFYANYLTSLGYVYGTHYWPHDGNKKIVAGEIKTSKQIAKGLGINPITIVSRTSNRQFDIINKCKPALPRCWFDEVGCSIGIAHLDGYRKEWDDKLGVWKDQPRHDECSHGADAFRTFACGYEGRKEELVEVLEESNYGYEQQIESDMDYEMFD